MAAISPRKRPRLVEGGDCQDFKRDASVPGVPSGVISAAFRTPKDGVGQASGSASSEWIVFRITDVTIPPVDMASDDVRKLKDTLERGLTDEQLAQFVNKIESDIGTSINQAAFAQVTAQVTTEHGREKWAPVFRLRSCSHVSLLKVRDGRSEIDNRKSRDRRDAVA